MISLTFYAGAGEIGGNKILLEYAIKTINPDILIPIHTRNPKEYIKIHDKVMIVKRGETIHL